MESPGAELAWESEANGEDGVAQGRSVGIAPL